jgi:IS5 family transposase
MKKNLGFAPVRSSGPTGLADFALANSLKHNRSLKLMDKLNNSLNWDRIQSVLMSHYNVGTNSEGADAYPPLLLFKCLMLQKWFRINSDPELENQINDRLSFKKFLQLPLDKPSPDHSTFSRFRSPPEADPRMPWIISTPKSCASLKDRA